MTISEITGVFIEMTMEYENKFFLEILEEI